LSDRQPGQSATVAREGWLIDPGSTTGTELRAGPVGPRAAALAVSPDGPTGAYGQPLGSLDDAIALIGPNTGMSATLGLLDARGPALARALAARGLRPRTPGDRPLSSVSQLKSWLDQGPLLMDGARWFGEGHWFVAIGYDQNGIQIRDSSGWDTRYLAWTRLYGDVGFSGWWSVWRRDEAAIGDAARIRADPVGRHQDRASTTGQARCLPCTTRHTSGMLVGSRVRGPLAYVVAIAALALLVVAAVWLALVLLAAGGVLWFNLVILPRLTRRLGVPRVALEVILLLALAAGGWLLGATSGVALGCLVWLVGIGLPRLVGAWLRARVRIIGWTAGHGQAAAPIPGRSCPRCGLITFLAGDRCRRCGTPFDSGHNARPALPD
jgi:hypothetical protein